MWADAPLYNIIKILTYCRYTLQKRDVLSEVFQAAI